VLAQAFHANAGIVDAPAWPTEIEPKCNSGGRSRRNLEKPRQGGVKVGRGVVSAFMGDAPLACSQAGPSVASTASLDAATPLTGAPMDRRPV
jgi:hypothetical protein